MHFSFFVNLKITFVYAFMGGVCEGHEGYTPGRCVPTEPSCPMQYMHI